MGSSENFLQLIKTQVIRYGGLSSRSGMVGSMLGLLIRGLLFFGELFSRMFNVQRNEVTDPARVSFFGGYDQPKLSVAFGEWTTVAAIREEHKALLKAWIKLR